MPCTDFLIYGYLINNNDNNNDDKNSNNNDNNHNNNDNSNNIERVIRNRNKPIYQVIFGS